MPFPCQKGGMGVECGFWFKFHELLFSDRFRVKPYPLKQKEEG